MDNYLLIETNNNLQAINERLQEIADALITLTEKLDK